MTIRIRLLALGLARIISAHPSFAASQQGANCSCMIKRLIVP